MSNLTDPDGRKLADLVSAALIPAIRSPSATHTVAHFCLPVSSISGRLDHHNRAEPLFLFSFLAFRRCCEDGGVEKTTPGPFLVGTATNWPRRAADRISPLFALGVRQKTSKVKEIRFSFFLVCDKGVGCNGKYCVVDEFVHILSVG